ncbi:hypothetical protein A2861_03385 [Candidatus Roizmanbacteria bacterium RIFCSPHIGHO2_01_FULL_38_15]|nr:MAG: hypothetical protein A2861_03385 [Candidatus Roizmanbacteria bacterium RIFCSPHIGHO2_01_FULL_38_15]OGK36199.1 MAG: hypothetical protein A3F59_04495 [Candidatus Roizmanbacteria bacterium RIFCSPHIGHO2_12_FULL_38_13]
MISAVVLTHNSEKSLEACLKSIGFCDEVLVVDDNSKDRTLDIAKKYSAKIVKSNLEDDFSKQRNLAMNLAKHDWVLFIDDDEMISNQLRKEIIDKVQRPTSNFQISNTFSNFRLKRRDHWWGRVLSHGEVAEAYDRGFIRLVKKNSGVWTRRVHEEFVPNGQTGQLNGYIDHFPHPTVTDFLHDINHYSTVASQELVLRGYTPSIAEIMFVPVCKFIYTYFIKLGFLDGPAGFAYSFFMSFHSFLTRAKAYQQRNFK